MTLRTIALTTALTAALSTALLGAAMPLAAYAAGPADPVERILKITEARWASTEGDVPDYFDALERDFSKDFAAVYREAQKYPVFDGSDTPFDYDVITSSQDGCPLKDLTVSPEGEKAGVTVVGVTFKLWTCAPDAESQARVNELKFDVVTEGGKPVIADIHRLNEGKWDSLVAEMKQGIDYAKNPPAQQE
jgi:hypothetical protein